VINEMVCEGCGDCSVKSNCLSVEPLETEYGRKRTINQSSCNKDYSCLKGFCPSFVTVEGGRLKKGKSAAKGNEDFPPSRNLRLPRLENAYGILVTGIGGTGVITIGQIIGVAAHLEGKGVSVLDMSGSGAEIRRRDVARADRARSTGPPRHAPRYRRRAPRARLRPRGDGEHRSHRPRWRRRARAPWSTRA
jgi:hypothetical protein